MSGTVEKGVMWITQLLLKLATWFCNFLIVVLALVAPAILLALIPGFIEDLPREANTPYLIMLGFAGVMMTMCLVVLFRMFIMNLRAIVDTVDEGSPFVMENAYRLRRMGWISIFAYPLLAVLASIGWGFSTLYKDEFDFELSADFTGIITILLLFILARVFEQGVTMREELEGTV